ncbi:MAG: hypothetical protein R2867_00965 [Caldilineaceae bacterium]
MDIKSVLRKEIALVNRMFQQNGIRAKVTAKRTAVIETGYIHYGLTLAMDEKFASVEKIQRAFQPADQQPATHGLCWALRVIPVSTPRLGLEAPTFAPHALLWSPEDPDNAGAQYVDWPQLHQRSPG